MKGFFFRFGVETPNTRASFHIYKGTTKNKIRIKCKNNEYIDTWFFDVFGSSSGMILSNAVGISYLEMWKKSATWLL